MYLKKLDIAGFKSFAHKSALEFDRGIVSIVGPNGSGKSNVADAIRWVLGEQSMKVLRGKRSDDVIFSGSDRKARLGMAEVTMTLDNSDGQMPVDYKEVAITRRVYRNGEGEYFLNKHPVRLQDITLIMARSGIGQKSYSVIGQGMIDAVLMSTPAERKVFFDEAAGVRQYQIKREQAIHKLEQTRENLSQANMLLAEIEPRLRTLTRQVRRLERRGAIEQELRSLQQQYYSQRYVTLLASLDEREKQFAAHQKDQHGKEDELAALQGELEKLEKERSRQEVFQELQHEYSAMLEQKNAVLKEQAVLEGAEELEAAKSGELNLVWLHNRERELDRSLTELRDQLAQLDAEHKEQSGTLAEKRKLLEKLFSSIASSVEKFQRMKERVERAGQPVAELESGFATFHEEFAAFQQSASQADSERHLAKLKREISRFHEKLTGLLHQLRGLKAGVQARDIVELQDAFHRLVRSKDELEREVHDLSTRVERRQERLALLRDSEKRLAEERERAVREIARFAPSQAKGMDVRDQRRQLEEQLATFDKKLQSLREQIMNFNQKEQKKKEQLFALQKSFRVKQNELNETAAKVNAARVELARLETRRDDLAHEVRSETPSDIAEKVLRQTAASGAEGGQTDEQLLAAINDRKHQLELVGGIDEGVTQEYKMTDERHSFLSAQVKDLTAALEQLETVIAELDAMIKEQFHRSFNAINKEFGKYFKILFNGGSAKLSLIESEVVVDEEGIEVEDGSEEDEEDASSQKSSAPKKTEKVIAGIEIVATPPGKRISGITMLSGGERALASIALICAILANRQSPFVVLDEVDAALDEANTQRFATILQELAHRTQFITITHNRSTMQISSILYGITMSDDGISKLLSIKMEDAERVMEQHGNRK